MYQKQQPKIVLLDVPPRVHMTKNFTSVTVHRGMDAKVFNHLQENARKQVKWASHAWRMEAEAITAVDINVPKV